MKKPIPPLQALRHKECQGLLEDAVADAQKGQSRFEESSDAVMMLSPPCWHFTDGNQAALQLFGISSLAGLTACGPWDFSPGVQPDGRDSREKALEMIKTALLEGSLAFEWQHRQLNGQPFPAEVVLTRIQSGEKMYLQATVRNITGRLLAARLLAEAQLITESEQKFRKITESTQDAIIMMDAKRCIALWNPAAASMFNYTETEAMGQEMHALLAPPEAQAAFEQGIDGFLKNGTGPVIGKTQVLTALRKGGLAFPVEVTISALLIDNKWNALGIFRDITARQQAEQTLIRSLAEKEVMMREIHHRVKNNMQMMAALLELQANHVQDEQSRAYFRDSQQRIRSMAMIHEQLYRNDNIAKIDFSAYLHSLVNSLSSQFGKLASRITVEVHTSDCTLPVDIAIPCGLVVNELASNVFKHAYPDGYGVLRISLQTTGTGLLVLEVSDDGVGLPAGLDIHKSKSFGMQLLTLLVETQLHGKVIVKNVPDEKPGTRIVCEIGVTK